MIQVSGKLKHSSLFHVSYSYNIAMFFCVFVCIKPDPAFTEVSGKALADLEPLVILKKMESNMMSDW